MSSKHEDSENADAVGAANPSAPKHGVMPATWALLSTHAKRDALFLVQDPVSLEEAADALAADDKAKVAGWIDSSVLRRPSSDELSLWDSSPVAFLAVIVQPFVLAKPLSLDAVDVDVDADEAGA